MNKKILLFLVPLALTIFSCKKLIELKETDFIDESIALSTVPKCEQGIIGAYAGFGTEMSIRLNGVFSDELKPGDFYASTSTHEWQYTSNDISIRDNYTATTSYYTIVDRVNRVLRALPDATAVGANDEALRNRIKGEALFLRAYCHFELYRYYCANYTPTGLAMPYMEEPSLEPKPRIEMAPFFEKLEADLNEAKNLLPTSLADINRATRLAAVGLHARVALYKKEWANAITHSTEYINALPLATGSDFLGIWTDANAREQAFKLRRTSSSRVGSWYRGLFTKTAPHPVTGKVDTVAPASISWVPSEKQYKAFDSANDIRYQAYVINEPLLKKSAGKPYKIVHKYAGSGYTSNNENVADIKLIRTAEMYLIRAEARAESGTFTGANSAESDINALRAARITGHTDEIFASKDAAITAIVLERFKELAFEGHRFWDLKRRELAIERWTEDAPTPAGLTLPKNNFRFILPIPQSEILANVLMEQNPGYEN
jgi:starch-binding outer membrane protein, SusD/RagB family